MKDSIALWSGVAGIAIGGLIAGALWWLDVSSVLIIGAGAVWATALGLYLYVVTSEPKPSQSGPWGAVIGSSLLFGVLISLSDITISNGGSAALSILVIGFTLLGYAGGVAAVNGQDSVEADPAGTPVDT